MLACCIDSRFQKFLTVGDWNVRWTDWGWLLAVVPDYQVVGWSVPMIIRLNPIHILFLFIPHSPFSSFQDAKFASPWTFDFQLNCILNGIYDVWMTLTRMRNILVMFWTWTQYSMIEINYSLGAPSCVYTRYDMGTQTSLKRHCHVSGV